MKFKIFLLIIPILLISSCFRIRSKRPELSAEDKIIKQASSRLYNKIRYGSVRDLEYYIERGAKVDKPIPLGMSDNPLIHALETHNLTNTWYLLSQDCDITSIDKWGNNALMWAMYRGADQLTKELIKRGSDVTITNKVGNTPFDKRGNNLIEYAGRCRSSIDIVKLLFEKGAKVTDRSLEYCIGEERGSDGIIDVGKLILDKTIEAGYDTKLDPLVEAVMLNDIEFVQSYIDNIDKIDDDATKLLRSTLKYMSALGYSELLEIVIKFLDNPDDNYTYEVTVACWYDQIKSINTLITLGADIKQLDSTETPLMITVRHNNKELTKLLLDNGAKFTASKDIIFGCGLNLDKDVTPNNTFLVLVCKNSDVEMFDLLITYGFDLSNTSMIIPYNVLENKKNIEILKYLSRNGFDINNHKNSKSLVYHSCSTGLEITKPNTYEVLTWLVDNGADMNSIGENPINHALRSGGILSVKKTKYLLEHGATIDKKSIIYAIDSGYLENVKMIIDAGADIYRYSYFTNSLEGRNALQIASEAGYLDIVKYFISLGMNPSYPAKDGDNSLHGVGSPEVKEYLLSLGVDREINSDNMRLPDDN